MDKFIETLIKRVCCCFGGSFVRWKTKRSRFKNESCWNFIRFFALLCSPYSRSLNMHKRCSTIMMRAMIWICSMFLRIFIRFNTTVEIFQTCDVSFDIQRQEWYFILMGCVRGHRGKQAVSVISQRWWYEKCFIRNLNSCKGRVRQKQKCCYEYNLF